VKNNYWNNKRTLITGINGFVGGNLASQLINNKAIVYGLIRNHNHNSFYYYSGLDKKCITINGDLLDKDLLKRVIIEERITHIFHLGAQVEVGIAMQNPFDTFETNVRGTYTLLSAVYESNIDIKSIVIASSDKVYGDYPINKLPYKEDYPLKGIYPYDVSKACADIISKSFSTNVLNLPVCISRFSNIYGPGQLNFSAIIPDCIRSSLGYTQFEPRSDGSNLRDYLFIDDVTNLYLILGMNLDLRRNELNGEVFNFGLNNPLSVKEVIEVIYRKLEKYDELEIINNKMLERKTSGEISDQLMDYEKVYKYFKYRPSYSFDKGINLTITWYDKYFKST